MQYNNSTHGQARQFAPQASRPEARSRTTPKPLNFGKAMNDFSTMFPELDRDVIETVLRANNGVVQATIDQLLMLQETTIEENKKADQITTLPSYESSIGQKDEEPPPAYNDIWNDVASPTPDQTDLPAYSNVSSAQANSGGRFWNARLVGKLPDDFLRLSPSKKINTPSSLVQQQSGNFSSNPVEDFMTDEEIERFLEDEKLAMFLQNEEFLRELRRNQEFVTSLEADHQRAVSQTDNPTAVTATANTTTPTTRSHGGARPRTSPQQPQQQQQAASTQNVQDDAAFRHKLRHMGKSTKKKFGKIAKKFSRTRNSTRLPSMVRGGESTFNLLEEEDNDDSKGNEYMGLDGIADNEDSDEGDNEYDGDAETEEERDRQKRARPTGRQLPQPGKGRQLPQPPGSQSSGTDEPIVFYSEDNEFDYYKSA